MHTRLEVNEYLVKAKDLDGATEPTQAEMTTVVAETTGRE